jgi:hypothetical protein
MEMKKVEGEREKNEVVKKTNRGGTFWKVLGGAMVLAVAAGVVANLKDVRRYIKISTM